MRMTWELRLLGRTKEGSISFCYVGHPCTSGLLCCLASEVGVGPPERERPPGMEKQAAAFEKAARVRCCACPLRQCGICSAVSACASPVVLQAWGGGNIHRSRRWTLFIILILWEGLAVQVLWGSNWSPKNKELACHGAWERNEKKKKKEVEKGVQVCGRMTVAEISTSLRNRLSSCIAILAIALWVCCS